MRPDRILLWLAFCVRMNETHLYFIKVYLQIL